MYYTEIRSVTENRECTYCNGKFKIDKCNSLGAKRPDLVKLLHPTLNNIDVFKIAPQSDILLYWICNDSKCGCEHVYDMNLGDKYNGQNCPYCAGHRCDKHNSIGYLFPKIAEQIHPTLNGDIDPFAINSTSHKKLYFICYNNVNKCGCVHIYESSIRLKCYKKYGCPICAGKSCDYHNSIYIKYPNIAEELNVPLNGEINAFNLTCNSNKDVFWNCLKNPDHLPYKQSVYNKCKRGDGCPQCSTIGYSKMAIRWLSYMELFLKCKIQHAENGGEKRIKINGKSNKVDGYCESLNTIFEFHGDIFHGNTDKFDKNHKNWRSNKTMQSLLDETNAKIKRFRDAGYNVIEIWESDFKLFEKHMNKIFSLNIEEANIYEQKNNIEMKFKSNDLY
jgi:hypothetical protein